MKEDESNKSISRNLPKLNENLSRQISKPVANFDAEARQKQLRKRQIGAVLLALVSSIHITIVIEPDRMTIHVQPNTFRFPIELNSEITDG
jgi:hypothetical protein